MHVATFNARRRYKRDGRTCTWCTCRTTTTATMATTTTTTTTTSVLNCNGRKIARRTARVHAKRKKERESKSKRKRERERAKTSQHFPPRNVRTLARGREILAPGDKFPFSVPHCYTFSSRSERNRENTSWTNCLSSTSPYFFLFLSCTLFRNCTMSE